MENPSPSPNPNPEPEPDPNPEQVNDLEGEGGDDASSGEVFGAAAVGVGINQTNQGSGEAGVGSGEVGGAPGEEEQSEFCLQVSDLAGRF